MAGVATGIRLTQTAHGGGCACKIPPGELEELVRDIAGTTLAPDGGDGLVVGLGDDAAVVRIVDGVAVVVTADFFTPVVDDPYDWGRIAAANALSDIYAMGGTPLVAVNLLGWPRTVLPFDLARDVLRGGLAVANEAGCHVAGGHSVDDPEPKYGMAVTGVANPDALLRHDSGRPGLPLTLTKPLGVGVLNNRHKTTGEVFPEAVAADFVPGGTRRNLAWVAPSLTADVEDDELLLLADAQTSGGLLCAGEVADYPVIGELVPAGSLGDGVVIAVR